jgi:hemerythrin
MISATLNSAVWNDSMLVGYTPLDAVHKEFFDQVHAVLDADDDEILAAMIVLRIQTRTHFEMEERWMAETRFPARGCHADEHAAVLASVTGVCEQVSKGDASAVRPLAEALLEWFPAHADHMDSALAHWMCKLRHGGAPLVLRRGVMQHVAAAALPVH